MVDPEVRSALLRKLRITKQALSLRAQTIKSKHGPMSTEEAVYVIAHQNGIDLSKYLSLQTIDRVRSLLPRDLPVPQARAIRKAKPKARAQKPLTQRYPLVPEAMSHKGVSMGQEAFPKVFVVENSIRNLIAKKLEQVYGKEWWLKANISNIRNNVQRTIDREKKFPHREKRGLHPLFYTNFAELKGIILNEQDNFKDIILDFKWLEVEMNEVYMARNGLAHSIAISEDDSSKIRIFFNEWARLLETAGYR
jgi:hypothetical protein